VVVLLDGQGGDELLAGYPLAWGFAARSQSLRRLPPAAFLHAARSLAIDHLPSAPRRAHWRRVASPYATGDPTLGEPPPPADWMRAGDPLRRELWREAFITILPELLRYADRSSMAHSREVRLPFLDRRVAELAFSLPADHLYRRGIHKAILRDAVRGVVPATVLRRRDKVAFEPPQARWLNTPAFRERIREVLLDPAARGRYDAAAIEADAAGRWRDPAAIWRALNAELWLQRALAAPRALVA
jgi:asparagine synthase (glutamine-hydrolysing)